MPTVHVKSILAIPQLSTKLRENIGIITPNTLIHAKLALYSKLLMFKCSFTCARTLAKFVELYRSATLKM
eukprot:UN16771